MVILHLIADCKHQVRTEKFWSYI